MEIKTAIAELSAGRDLKREDLAGILRAVMSGEGSPAQIGALLMGLHMKGETVMEITAGAQIMRELLTPVTVADPSHLVDTCGTGGDLAHSFNISTAAAFVAAAAGAKIAKHGNRSVSSRSGSADLLEAAGVALELDPQAVSRCIDELGIGFLYAPNHHRAMRHASSVRRELGIRTIFNLLGPLTNPAGAPHQVLGVFDQRWVQPCAQVLKELGSRHVMVVHGEDGLDEISINAPTTVAELKNGKVSTWTLLPSDFGIAPTSSHALTVADARESLATIHEVFAGTPGPAREIVALNAAAAIYVAGLAQDLFEARARAFEAIDSGGARDKLAALGVLTQSLAKSSSGP